MKTPSLDPRVDALPEVAVVFSDTQLRIAFAPKDTASRVTALGKSIRQVDIDAMQAACSLGEVHVQLKTGFAPERRLVLSIPELLLIMELADRFVVGLPMASKAKPIAST